jgi:hypothetical protein
LGIVDGKNYKYFKIYSFCLRIVVTLVSKATRCCLFSISDDGHAINNKWTGASSIVIIAYSSAATEFIPGWVCVAAQYSVLCILFFDHHLSFRFCCLFVFYLVLYSLGVYDIFHLSFQINEVKLFSKVK